MSSGPPWVEMPPLVHATACLCKVVSVSRSHQRLLLVRIPFTRMPTAAGTESGAAVVFVSSDMLGSGSLFETRSLCNGEWRSRKKA
jgi:hypothetical protein